MTDTSYKLILLTQNFCRMLELTLETENKFQHAKQLAERSEIHYTPKHGSWLDIAGIELSALVRQCIAKNRIPDLPTLRSLLVPWFLSRNSAQKGVDWHCTTNDARTKLNHRYPVIKFQTLQSARMDLLEKDNGIQMYGTRQTTALLFRFMVQSDRKQPILHELDTVGINEKTFPGTRWC